MNMFQQIYDTVPPICRDLLLSIRGWQLARKRFGGEYAELLRDSLAHTFAPAAVVRESQRVAWHCRIAPALQHVEAYRGYDLRFDSLTQLPITSKAELKKSAGAYTFLRRRASPFLTCRTSGTTGAGFAFPVPLRAHRRQWATWWRYRLWHGIQPSEWCAVFGGRPVVPSDRRSPPYWHVNVPGRAILFSQYHLNDARAPLYLAEIRRRGIRWIHGYPSVVGLLAQFGIASGLAGTMNVQWVTLGSENVLPSQREAIHRMFGVVPRQHYGLAEGVANISECPLGRMHIDEDYSVVELVPTGAAGTFRLIGTSLDNDAMPFVRYDTGDLVTVASDSTCSCGRSGRVITSIDGREEDQLELSDGTLVGRASFFKQATNVVEAQIVQRQPGHAVFRIVRGPAYSAADELQLRSEVAERVGARLSISFEYLSALPRTRSGKLRLVVRE